ncbi:hypothetical protein BDZ91DRAFT_746332 [Kalaharituber pfeilii]|nr:hypothetical protein BDZ91DRAFT_746332 [Kalaharituber pfeilii]
MRCPAEVVPVDGVSKRHFFFFFWVASFLAGLLDQMDFESLRRLFSLHNQTCDF